MVENLDVSKKKRKQKIDTWNKDNQEKNESIECVSPFFSSLKYSEWSMVNFILCPCGVFKLSLFRISGVTTFLLIWFDYLS